MKYPQIRTTFVEALLDNIELQGSDITFMGVSKETSNIQNSYV